MADLDIWKLKKINGQIYELNKISKVDIIAYRDDCQNNINRINQDIEALEHKRDSYQREIDEVVILLRRDINA